MKRVVLVGSAIALVAIRADADPAPTLQLEYIAPAACPDSITVRAGVMARLGRDPFAGTAPRKAFVDVESTRAGFVAAIELREPGRESTRRAVGPAVKCEDATAALELALAVIIDPSYADTPAPQPAPEQPAPPRLYPPPGWNTAALPEVPPVPANHELALTLGSLSGPYPTNAFVFGLRASFLVSQFRFGVIARFASALSSLDDGSSLRVTGAELLAEGCVRYWHAVGCGHAGFGSKGVQAENFSITVVEPNRDYSKDYFVVGGSVGLDIPLGRVFLRPEVELDLTTPDVAVIAPSGQLAMTLGGLQLGFDLAIGIRW